MGTIYIGNTWSPSSYGLVLQQILGVPDSGPDWGKPRAIRSDELAVVTPLTQATINNGFERYNHTSLYGEDLRMNYGLPVHDWGIAFKPTMWLYGWVNPAYAFSFHWFMLAGLFLLGYAWLFRWLGASPGVAYALSAGIYFTGFVQFWWNEKGSEFALFPWVILALASRLPLVWKAPLFYWIAVAWLLTNFYPPVQIPLAFVGLVLLFARESQLFKPRSIAVLAFAAALAAGTAALYLWDYLQATATTIYPGTRRVPGGTVSWIYLRSWLWPAINFDRGYQSLLPSNICEIGTPGLYYTLLAICFLDFTRWRDAWTSPEKRRSLVVLGVGLAAMFAWLLLPLPPWAGYPLLWNFVQPERMQYAAGLLLICLLFVLLKDLGLRITVWRIATFLATLLLGWWYWKYRPAHTNYDDLVILVFLPPALLVARFRPTLAHGSLATASLLSGIILFGHFNPLQSAWPIFNRPANDVAGALARAAKSNDGLLAVAGLPGAVGNGLGYRSLSHLTAVPQLEFWRKHFPDIPAAELDAIFNRYSHIIPDDESTPRLLSPDSVGVPVGRFQGEASRVPVRYVPPPAQLPELDGHIDGADFEAGRLVIFGWGPWSGPPELHELEVSLSPVASGPPRGFMRIRPDLPAATRQRVSALNGFWLSIPIDNSAPPTTLCLVAHDASTGKRTLLHNPQNLLYCTHADKVRN